MPGTSNLSAGGTTVHQPVQRKEQLTDTIGLGFFFWFAGYIASIVLYFLVPSNIIGWILFVLFTPVFIAITLLRFRKRSLSFRYYVVVAVLWTGMAIILDFLFIVKLFNPDNYYHLSVLIYYLETFLVPVITGGFYRSGV